MARQVVNQWILESHSNSPPLDHGLNLLPAYSLKPGEKDKVRNVLKIENIEMAEKVEKLLKISLNDYVHVRRKLVSLLFSWD